MKHKIRMIGLDLDGTALNDRKELSVPVRKAIKDALDAGIVVLVATGRPWMGVPEELRYFPGMRYALTSNGARILEVAGNRSRVLIEHLLSPELAEKTLEICSKYDTLQEIYYDGQGYAPADGMDHVEKYHRNPAMCEYMKKTRIQVDDILQFAVRENRAMDKVQALFADMDERRQAWKELEQIPGLALVGSLKYNIEINAEGVDKGKGLLDLAQVLGIKREEIMACGDGDNDIAMLREAGLGIAMANAEDDVKAAADYVTLSNEEDGVAEAIYKFALGGGDKRC